MTLTEFRRSLLSSNNAQWLNSIEVTFAFDYVDYVSTIKGLSGVYELVLKQSEGWSKFGEELPKELNFSKTYWEGIKGALIFFLNNNKDVDEIHLNRAWARVKGYINDVSNRPLRFNSPETEFILKVHGGTPLSVSAAFKIITGLGVPSMGNKDQLIGTLMAYEFIVKDKSEIVKRARLERSKLSEAKKDFDTYIGEAEHELIEHINALNRRNADYLEQIENLRIEKDASFNKWFEESNTKFQTFETQSKGKINVLETAYGELLRLSKPAAYWKQRAVELNKEGKKFMCWLIGLVVLTAIMLFSILWLTPESMLSSFFDNDKSAAVRWTIVFITLISFLAYGIRALTKATFSAFHLSRDAEERERLVYVYLAMVKDSAVDKEERHLIMQSLFSRADTGLLKDDSSPTMPGAGSVFEKFGK